MTDLRQTSAWANYLRKIGWQVEKIDNTYYFLKHLPFLGYLLKIQRPDKIDFKAIQKLTKKYKVYKIAIEPKTKFESLNFKLTKAPFLPTKTLQIDLSLSLKKILSQMHSKTRYNIRLAQKKGVVVKKSQDIKTFLDFWRKNFESKRFPFLSQKQNILTMFKAFNKNAYLLLAYSSNQVIAGLLLLRIKNTAYYMYAVSNNQGRKLFAPTLLTWKGIELAKQNKCKIFDFDGIYDGRFPLPTWKGFTKFKKGFGGKEIEYPGCFVKINFPYIIP